mgnify:CR=1 FL=1
MTRKSRNRSHLRRHAVRPDAGGSCQRGALLAVGDALVAQIPGLLISVAAAMVVSRVGKEQNIGSQIGTQVFGSSKALGITVIVVTHQMESAFEAFVKHEERVRSLELRPSDYVRRSMKFTP